MNPLNNIAALNTSTVGVIVPPQTLSAAEKVSTRVTPVAVNAPLPEQHLNDNLPRATISQEATLVSVKAAPPAVITGNSIPPDVTFAQFLPAPEYNTLVGYGFVKFKPSNAGLGGSSDSVSPPATHSSGEESTARPAPEYQAYSNTQTRNRTQLSGESVPQVISG